MFMIRERLEARRPRSGAAADGRTGLHHRTEEPDHQQLGPGHAEVRTSAQKQQKHIL